MTGRRRFIGNVLAILAIDAVKLQRTQRTEVYDIEWVNPKLAAEWMRDPAFGMAAKLTYWWEAPQ